jgi:ribosomal protein S19
MLYVDLKKKTNTLRYLKLNYYSSQVWRLMFLINSNSVYSVIVKKIYNRSTNIPYMFLNYEVLIYSGLKWLVRVITKWTVGFKLGSLSWNRKRAVFKSKQLKKK